MGKLRFIELFAGIGGFRLGLERAGMQHAWSNELNEETCKVYSAAHGGEITCGDVREVPSDLVPEHDVLSAGFPCQPFSNAGSNKGFQDARGTLFFEVARILRDKQPVAAILENVPGLLTNDGGKTFATILSILSDCGYESDFALLNSSDFGVPQSRERVYIVAIRSDACPLLSAGGRKRPMLEVKSRTGPLMDLIPNAPGIRRTLGIVKPKTRVDIPPALEERLRAKLVERPESLLRVRDNRTGFQSVCTWHAELFGPVSSDEKRVLEAMRQHFQDTVYNRLAKECEVRHGTPSGAPADFGASDEMMESLAARGYVRSRPGPKYSLINRNLLPGRLPSCYGGPECMAPTLTASNLHQFAMIESDGVYGLGPEDFEVVQGFPPGFTDHGVPEKSRLRMVGNSVVPAVVEWVGRLVSSLTSSEAH